MDNATSLSKFSERSMTSIQKMPASQLTGSSSSFHNFGGKNGKASSSETVLEQQILMHDVQEDIADKKGLPKDDVKVSAENGRGHRFPSTIDHLDASIEGSSRPASSNSGCRQDFLDKTKDHAESKALKDLHVGVVN